MSFDFGGLTDSFGNYCNSDYTPNGDSYEALSGNDCGGGGVNETQYNQAELANLELD